MKLERVQDKGMSMVHGMDNQGCGVDFRVIHELKL